MKNATKHAEELRSLLKKLLKEHKPAPRAAMEPLKALVRGAMSYDVTDSRAEEAMKAIEKEFVDLNELRVATDLEIQELLGVKYPNIEKRVAMITQSLNAIFEREHTLNLERLKSVKKSEVRQFLRDLPEVHPFVEAYVTLFGFEENAMPLDDRMLSYLQGRHIIEEGTTLEEAQKFVENNLKMDEMYDFYQALRAASDTDAEDSKGKRKAKA
jgi:endonuclease III